MNSKKTQTTIKSTLAGLMLVIIMVVATVTGCSPATGSNSSQNSGSPPVQVDSGEGGREGGGEHGSGGEGREGGREHGSGGEGREGGREAGEGGD